MPYAAPTPCIVCRTPVRGASRCPQHAIDAIRPSSPIRGYDKAWQTLRREVIQRDRFTCQDCGWQPSMAELCNRYGEQPPLNAVFEELRARQQAGQRHLQVDHVKPIAERPDLRLVRSNLRTLCSVCHSAKTMSEMHA